MRTTFWGVRGSVPTPGPDTAGIGGNTSCVEVRCGETLIVLDGGTGLRLLGKSLANEEPLTAHVLFSHVHWDHIQGFPFFQPAFSAGNVLHLYAAAADHTQIRDVLARQMRAPDAFPVGLRELPAELRFHPVSAGDRLELDGGVHVTTAAGTHPGGVIAYRIEHDGSALVYATDTEHSDDGLDERLLELARGADVLIYDSQYTPEEYDGARERSKVGWGHSTFVEGAKLAEAAGVGRYVLFHHDPDQDDDAVRDKERRAKELFAASMAAYEGLVLEL